MKKILALFALAIFVTGCASQMPVGMLLTDNTLPLQVGDKSVVAEKVGTATSNSYLGLIATGDCSIATACKNGGISQISHVDWKVKNTLGFFGEYTVTVYGK